MTVTFLGTGTSQGVPIIGCQCAVCKSTDEKDNRLRSSILISTPSQNIVIDSGPDFRQQMLREDVRALHAVLFTHEHKDHIAGLDDIRAYNYLMKRRMDVYCTEQVEIALKREFAYAFSGEQYPGIPEIDLVRISDVPFQIGDLAFTPIQVKHMYMNVLGFRFGDFVYITDANFISDEEKEKIKGCKTLVLNALRKESHPSHYTLDEAIALVNELQPQQAYFTHLSHQMGLHADISKDLPENIKIAYDGLKVPFSVG